MRVEGKLVMLEIDDPELATELEKAMSSRKVRIIKGTDPEAVGFPGLWSAVSRTVEDLTRRLSRGGGRGVGVPTEMTTFTPGEWDPAVDAASYRIVSRPDGTRAYLEVSPDVDREAVRSWLREWISANRILPGDISDATELSFVIQRVGMSFAMGKFRVVPAGSGAKVTVNELVDAALRDLSAQL